MSTERNAPRTQRATAVVAALGLSSLVACASEPPPRPVRLDPSNPSAPEAPPASFTPLLGSGPVADAPGPAAAGAALSGEEHEHAAQEAASPTPAEAAGHGHHHHGAREQGRDEPAKPRAPAAATYTCPMHPEVTSDKPGRCPKCGMNLVPRKGASGEKP